MNGTRAALTVIAAFFCTGKVEILAKAIEERSSRIKLKVMILPVDPQSDGDGSFNRSGRSILCGMGGGHRCGSEKRWRSCCDAGGSEVR